MKLSILLLFTISPFISFSQIFSRLKNETIQNIKNAGYNVTELKDAEYSITYTRYDEHGEAKVYFKCDNNIVRKIIFLCNPSTGAALRSQDILKNMTRDEFGITENKYGSWPVGSIISTKSKYYNGDAMYFNRIISSTVGEFTITILN